MWQIFLICCTKMPLYSAWQMGFSLSRLLGCLPPPGFCFLLRWNESCRQVLCGLRAQCENTTRSDHVEQGRTCRCASFAAVAAHALHGTTCLYLKALNKPGDQPSHRTRESVGVCLEAEVIDESDVNFVLWLWRVQGLKRLRWGPFSLALTLPHVLRLYGIVLSHYSYH